MSYRIDCTDGKEKKGYETHALAIPDASTDVAPDVDENQSMSSDNPVGSSRRRTISQTEQINLHVRPHFELIFKVLTLHQRKSI